MLSRIAESLFWIGRYCERAEDTARLLQVHLRLQIEDTSTTDEEASRSLLSLMAIPQPEHPTTDDLLRTLGYDRNEPTSIVASWAAARDNARRAREVIPADLWRSINTTWHQLPSGRFRPSDSHTFLDWARERSALFTGLARASMVRDDGWQFLLLGRSLEQADMTSRMVAAASRPVGSRPWPAVLRGCGGYEAFLRTHRGVRAAEEAAEFLIIDPRFPRSVMHGLAAASDCLNTLVLANPASAEENVEAVRALGRQIARLEYADLDELLANLDAEMTAVQETCALVTRTISGSFFAAKNATAWITEGAR